MRYARVDFGDTEVKPELREKYQGRLVGIVDGDAWSLAGWPHEGEGLQCPDDCLKPLSPHETEVAELLNETFWQRRNYTEDVGLLKALARQQVRLRDLKPGDYFTPRHNPGYLLAALGGCRARPLDYYGRDEEFHEDYEVTRAI